MRIVVTGGCGFIGTPVVQLVATAGHEVTVFDLAARGGDVRDAQAVRKVVAGADIVVHLAAKVGLEQGLVDLPDYVSHNDFGTAVLLAEAAAAGVRRVVLASSMVVYGEGLGRCSVHGEVRPARRRADDLRRGLFEPPCPYCGEALMPALVGEDAATDPRSGYAATKLAQEHLAATWARQSGGSVAALRFHNVYGPGLPRDTPYAGVAAIFRTDVLAGRAPRVTEDGGQRRDFVHVRDVAHACLAAAVSDAVLPGDLRAYNIGSGRVRTVLELAQALSKAGRGPEPVVTGEARLADVRHITASSERAAAELGWAAREDFEASMHELLDAPCPSPTPAADNT